MLEIKNLKVSVDDKIILENFNMTLNDGEIHALMGRNGAGKSTISKVLMGDKKYQILDGTIKYNDEDVLSKTTTEIARLGFFMVSQSPMEIEGVTNASLLRCALNDLGRETTNILKFNQELVKLCEQLHIDKDFIHRDINYNMSGGEKKKMELLHLFVLKPKFIILDEIDSGLDVDSLKVVSENLKRYYEEYKPTILIITHQEKLLKSLKPNFVHILDDKNIVEVGDYSLAEEIYKNGFSRASTIAGSEVSE